MEECGGDGMPDCEWPWEDPWKVLTDVHEEVEHERTEQFERDMTRYRIMFEVKVNDECVLNSCGAQQYKVDKWEQ